jgi:glycosyltransferase involved in cell wall biosynthesis
MLREEFDVHIVAACRPDDQVWAPARESCDLEIRKWTCWSYPGFLVRSPGIARSLVTGDVIYAVKPHLSSLGLAMVARRVANRPLIADVDDWELGFSSFSRDMLLAPWALLSAAAPLHTRLASTRVKTADAVTVSSSFLHAKYGGTWIPHARDPRKFAHESGRPPSGPPTVLFAGTPRKHKGVHDLLQAFEHVTSPARLRVIGGALDPDLSKYAASHTDSRISIEPPVSMEALGHILADAAIVVIPQRDTPASRGQLPAKLLDAMAAGKAIISTDVGDIPRWLADGAGIVVPPGDARALATAIDMLIQDPERRLRMGQQAQVRFLGLGAIDVVRPRLLQLVRDVITGKASLPAAPPFA